MKFNLDTYLEWLKKAIETSDRFADYLLNKYVVKYYDPDIEFQDAVRDENGFPKFIIGSPDLRVEMKTTTYRQVFQRLGLIPASPPFID